MLMDCNKAKKIFFINNYAKLNKILVKIFIWRFCRIFKLVKTKIILYFTNIKIFYLYLIYLINLN